MRTPGPAYPPRSAFRGKLWKASNFPSTASGVSSPIFPPVEIRRHALLNRSDILASLAEYAACESALRLEIAKQYPDIRIGPNYQLDQTDSKWTIGLALDLPILSRNKGPIAEAEARRAESAARFLGLQSQVIGELDAAVEECRSALQKSKAADDLLADLAKQESTAGARYSAGEISRLELLGIQLELNSSALAELEALVRDPGIGRPSGERDAEPARHQRLDLCDTPERSRARKGAQE